MIDSIIDFLEPLDIQDILGDTILHSTQIGYKISVHTKDHVPHLDGIDIIIIGCNEWRGGSNQYTHNNELHAIRSKFYQLFHWHKNITIADIGNIKNGKKRTDTYAAIKIALKSLVELNKKIILIGGDVSLFETQYHVFSEKKQLVHATQISANISIQEPVEACYLYKMLTQEPNFLKQYAHVAFQSYLIHPTLIEVLNKLHAELYRVGQVKEDMEEIEPILRKSHIIAFDINAIQYAFNPTNRISLNGLNGEDACLLMKYAGMSASLQILGIYGYQSLFDLHCLAASQIAQMLWYFIDGVHFGASEVPITDLSQFKTYHVIFGSINSIFIESMTTGRWWMQLPNQTWLPVSHKDYLLAKQNDIPPKYFRAAIENC